MVHCSCRDGEIVGLNGGESGRSCESHEVFGHHMIVGKLVKVNIMWLTEGGDYIDYPGEVATRTAYLTTAK
jgi:hypothetical protein